MDLPFYYSFKDFEENYTKDLNNFIDKYQNAREIDFLKEIKRLCLYWTKVEYGGRVFNNLIWTKEFTYSEYEGFSSDDAEITLDMFAYIVDCNVKHYLPFIGNPFHSFSNIDPFGDDDDDGIIIMHPIEHLFSLIENQRKRPDYFHIPNDYKSIHKKYLLDKIYHLEYFHFLYYEDGTIKADNEKFKDFGFAVFKIMDEIDRRIKLFELQKNNIIPVNGNSNENKKQEIYKEEEQEDISNLTTPEKIALLEYLGVFAKLIKDGVSPENEYKIIHNLIGGSYTNIKKYCLNRKTKNKSSKDYQITEKHKSKIKNFYNSKTF
jgi:hypothetical protein